MKNKNISHVKILQSKLGMITLQVTQQCNLRCKYCAYSGEYDNRIHSNKRLSFETAKKGIDFLFEHSYNSEQVGVGFYGGEPLLEFELIKKCIEYSEANSEGKELIFSITTNGTLLTKTVVEYLCSHNVSLVISLDGPKNVHDKNRRFAGKDKGSFDIVMKNVEAIKKEFPEYYKKIIFSVVIDPLNDFSCVNEFFTTYDTIKDLHTLPSMINQNYLKHDIKRNNDFSTKYGYEMFKVLLSKLGRLNKSYSSTILENYYFQLKRDMFENRSNNDNRLPEKGHPSGPCVPGGTRLFMDVNGFLYPCERVSESSSVMRIGHIESGFDVKKCFELLNIGKITEEACKNCWAFRFCTSCCAIADNLTGLSAEKKLSHCRSIKFNTELLLKDYCTLSEFGFHFDEKINNIKFGSL
ncbi:Cys-rich peptide radical SAM maturase CcpM [Ruminiclostridium herbifermentans]|uniref:Cys-rich peptide radical SAM maturase CcpM n=1 Tax=Ruminiclostridium herbifermentans TaxID=2488810 RepID=A0A4U7JHB8_9FIRM|nr:Cys-rich peptide radical SAM maturase CcpM [Ruminiclostridium herbifermentans]QNU67333.1 Cys-rich peptide radical SAM maturase CcpM [Ruminiclostridium herbifermentans]